MLENFQAFFFIFQFYILKGIVSYNMETNLFETKEKSTMVVARPFPTDEEIEARLNHLRSLLPIFRKVRTRSNELWEEYKTRYKDSDVRWETWYSDFMNQLTNEFNITVSDVDDIEVVDPFDALGEEFTNYLATH